MPEKSQIDGFPMAGAQATTLQSSNEVAVKVAVRVSERFDFKLE